MYTVDQLELNGKPHARIEDDVHIFYYHLGNFHREDDGPAIIKKNRSGASWYKYGLLHREDGPAEICFSYEAWYKNGKLHRENGPAIEYRTGKKGWYLNDIQLTEEEFNESKNKQ